jgi:GTP-binding protein HflX
LFERSRKGEQALLIQPHAGGPPDDGLLEEFGDLARSAGANVVAVLQARIDRPNPATLIGSGKLDEVKAAAEATGADLILVNHALSPVQERNLEKALERRVVDRTGLILDIFSQRARSAEGKLQVELAQLKHMATRLVRGWTHLERQRGGSIGLRGPGETQLETDRRLLQKRVEQLQKRLDKVEVQRTQMRRARVRSELPRIALVGYTNAGKSTLFNALTGAGAYAADQLFATLDPTVRRIALPGGNAVLAEIGAGELPQLLVYNKIDRIEGALPRHDHAAEDGAGDAAGQGARERVWVSARDGLGLEALRQALGARLGLRRVQGELRLPPEAGRLRARLHELDAVRGEEHDEDGWRLRLDLAEADALRVASQPWGEPVRALLVDHPGVDG